MGKNLKPHELRDRKIRIQRKMEKSKYDPNFFLPKQTNIPAAMGMAHRPAQPTPFPRLPEYHLFVSEGTETEPRYLRAMADFIAEGFVQKFASNQSDDMKNSLKHEVRKRFVIRGGRDNTLNLLKKAEEWSTEDDTRNFRHIWVIYDRDSFPGDDFDNTAHRCEALNQRFENNRTFHAIWSNECFEVWLVFHYMRLITGIKRSQYKKILSKKIGRKYKKNAPPAFKDLEKEKRRKAAVKNAKNQMAYFDAKTPPSGRNPCTNFYELVEYCMRYIK